MARLEIPSIVVHKGSRSQSRPSSPADSLSAGMPALPSVKNVLLSGTANVAYSSGVIDQEMVDGNVNVDNLSSPVLHRPTSLPVPPCQPGPPDKNESETGNFRNRTNTKVKLLIRSHAMRESTSPPREPHNGGASSPRSPQSDCSEKKLSNGVTLSPNSSSKINNNEPIYNSNLSATHSPKQTRTTATSPTCRAASQNGQSSPSQMSTKGASTSPTGNRMDKNDCQRSKATSPLAPKCNNCVKNNHNEKSALLQTPHSPKHTSLQYTSKSTSLPGQNNCQRPDTRRSNSLNVCNNQCSNQCANTLSVNNRTRHKLRHQNSSQGSGSIDSASPCLSRDNSTELYTDSTGIDLEQFIAVTINRNQKDRSVLLKIEKELIDFAKDRQKPCHKFPNMSSYNRMLVHRVAAYFGMEHNVDQSGLSVIVTRTKNMRIPDTKFKEHIRDDLLLTEEPRRSILKRDSSSFEDGYNFKSPDRMSGEYCRRSKSFEEREVEYEKARRRIFKDSSRESSGVASWQYWSSSESSEVSARHRMLHPGMHPSRAMTQRLSKGESCDGREAFRGVLRPSVSKSHSFGGYTRGMFSRGDSVTSTRSAGPRLTKQDSGASACSRLSPSSSGYKSQSQRSDTTISPSPSPSPIPTISCNHSQSSSQSSSESGQTSQQQVMWAVSSISSVPAGSIIMNPRTNQPYTNADGTIYRFDPDNPPKIFSDIEEIRESPAETPEKFVESPEHLVNPKANSSKKPKSPGKTSTNLNSSIANTSNNTNHRVTNTATSPTMPFASSPPPQVQECPQTTTKVTAEPCNHAPVNQSYGNYPQASVPDVSYPPPPSYPPPAQHQGMLVQRHPEIPPPQDMVFGQSNVYPNYSMMTIPQGAAHPQNSDVADLSGYFMGMNVYEQPRPASETTPTTPQYPVPPPPPPPPPQQQNGHNAQSGFWQQQQQQPPPPPQSQNHPHPPHHHPPNQMPTQQMYFVPPSGATMAVNSPANDRASRFTSSYAYNPQTIASPNNPSAQNYVNSYPIPFNSMPAVTPTPPDYPYQSHMSMIPTYYPAGQPGMQPPVMWRVPTPPNTPNSQMPGIPVMYMNAGTYPPPNVMTAGSFGHQLSNSANSGPPGTAYMTPGMLPNLIFRQNVPMVATGVRASTPSGSQRTSRSPTPAHEFFNNVANGGNCAASVAGVGGGCGDNRNAQVQPRYPLPMYQGLHIVQGDIRLMHPGNSRLHYAPAHSPPVVQGCPRPFRPPSYSSNTSGCPTPNSFDGRNPKIRKQRSKVTTLPSTGARSNVYQVPPMPSISSTPPKDIREGTVKVTITHRNPLAQ